MARARLARAVAALTALICAQALLEDALDIIRFGKEIGEEIINSWEVLGEPLNVSGGVELPLIRRRERELLTRLANVARAIDKLQMTVERGEVLTALVARGGARHTRLELRLHELADLQGRVDASDAQMREYTFLNDKFEHRTLEDFASWCVSHDPGAVTGLLDRVHALLIPSHKHLVGRGLFRMLADDLEVGVTLVRSVAKDSLFTVEFIMKTVLCSPNRRLVFADCDLPSAHTQRQR
ncbi:hypothetical protein EVAR_16196_1 [Eumeta japonica]|uniref:Uncharacterized protein n=1 Tax=Eumeta variegata TaxID=151549 RepID=A0A4C1U5V8_EUMVA|nr:hypothetical protein EVAR_16196_1 [Eumeta japonica]